MFCTICGAQVPEGSAYCEVCGAQIEQIPVQPAPQQMPVQQAPQQMPVQPAPQQVPVQQAPQQMPVQPAQQMPVQPVPQQNPMDSVMQQHEYARQMQEQYSNQSGAAEREVTQTQGMAMPNAQPPKQTPYPSIHHGEQSQSLMPLDNQVSQQYPPMMQQPAPQPMPMQQPAGKKSKKAPKQDGGTPHKKSKAPIIIAIIAVLLAIAAAIVFLVIKPFGKKSNAQTKALDRYFDAVDDLNIIGMDAACYPKSMLDETGCGIENAACYNQYYASQMGFIRGCASFDMFKMEPEIMASYPAFDIRQYSDADQYYLMMMDNDKFKDLYSDFSVEYELLELYKWDEITFSRMKGLQATEITDIDELIPSRGFTDAKYLDIDDAYVAQVKVKWYYGDKLYGFDKSWWSNPKLKDHMANSQYETYADAIAPFEKYVWNIVIYQYEGEWYVFPEQLTAALNMYRVEKK